MRAIGKYGNNNSVMTGGGEMNLDVPLFQAALQEGEASGIVVCGYKDKGMAVLLCPFQDGPYHLVEIEELFAHITNLIAMAPVINLGALDHEEEALLVIKHLNCLHCAFHQDWTTVQGRFKVVLVVQAQEFVPFCTGNVFKLVYVCIARSADSRNGYRRRR